MIAVARRPQRAYVDFAHVPVAQWRMHDRLELHWARWCRGGTGEKARLESSPMFDRVGAGDTKRERFYGGETEVPIDKDDALRLHFAIVAPDFHPQYRRALQWSYLRPKNPSRQAEEMGIELAELAAYVIAGRAMLIERGI